MTNGRHIDFYLRKARLIDSFDIEDEIYNFLLTLKESNGIGRVLYNKEDILKICGFCENRLSEIVRVYPDFVNGKVDENLLDTYRTYVYMKRLSEGLRELLISLDSDAKVNAKFVMGWNQDIKI